jgi:hypothetical protein
MTDPTHIINSLNTQIGIANTYAVDSEVRKNAQIREQQLEIDRLRDGLNNSLPIAVASYSDHPLMSRSIMLHQSMIHLKC